MDMVKTVNVKRVRVKIYQQEMILSKICILLNLLDI